MGKVNKIKAFDATTKKREDGQDCRRTLLGRYSRSSQPIFA